MSLDAYKKAMNNMCGMNNQEPKINLMTIEELQAHYGSKNEKIKQQLDELEEKLKDKNNISDILKDAEVNNV